MRIRPFNSVLLESLPLLPVLASYVLIALLHPELGNAPFLYAGFFVAFMLLPSIALSRLLPLPDLGVAERAFLGFPITLAVLFLTVWGGSRGTGIWWGGFLLPLIGLYAVFDLAWNRKRLKGSDPASLLLTTAILSLALLLSFDYFSHIPIYASGLKPWGYGDDGYLTAVTFSIIKAMESGKHAMEANFYGVNYVYHILMNISVGFAFLVTRIHPLFMQIYLYPVFHWFMLAGAVVAGARHIAKFDTFQTVLVAVLLLFVTGHSWDSQASLQMYSTFHTYFFGLPATILLAMLVYGYLNGDLGKLPVLYTTLTFLTVCSAKSVPLLLVPLSLVPVFAYRLWRRKVAKEELLFALGASLVAILLKAIEYDETRVVTLRKFNLFNSIMPMYNTLVDVLPFLFVFLLLCASARYYALQFRKNSEYIIFVSTMYVISITLPRIVNFAGGDQYFFWYTRVFFFVFCAFAMSIALRSHARNLGYAAIVAVMLSVGMFAWHRHVEHAKMESKSDAYALTRLEWDGLMWAFENIDLNARSICNGSYASLLGNRPVFGVQRDGIIDHSAISGLYSYACPQTFVDDQFRSEADTRLVNMVSFFEAATVEERLSWMKRMDVDYVFYCKRWPRGANFSLPPEYTVVYSNPDFEIYKVPSSGS